MKEIDLAQPAIVFWLQHPGMNPGAITRFERLADAIGSVIQEPSAKTAAVAWIKTIDRHIDMDEIRVIAQRADPPRSRLTWRLSQIAEAASDAAEVLELVPAGE
jgi:hypothetical protein